MPGWAYFWPPPVGSGDPVARLGSPGWRPVANQYPVRIAREIGFGTKCARFRIGWTLRIRKSTINGNF